MAARAVRPYLSLLVVLTAVALVVTLIPGAPADAEGQNLDTSSVPIEPFQEAEPVRLELPDSAMLRNVTEAGYDLGHEVVPLDDGGVGVTAFVTDAQLDDLLDAGASLPGERAAARSSQRMSSAAVAAAAEGVGVNVLRADWFENYSGTFISIEAKAAVDTPEEARALTVQATVDGETFNLSPFIDAGVYMYHRTSQPRPVDAAPSDDLVVTVADGGGSDSQAFEEWLPGDFPVKGRRYQEGFHDRYLDAVESTQYIEDLAAEFPDLAEVITLPELTNGYQRKAQVLLGSMTDQAFYATTHAWGHEGGNDWSIDVVDPGEPGQALSVESDGTEVTVSLATDGEGALASTAAQVVEALNGELEDVLWAATYRGNAGEGIVQPGSAEFSDYLSAPDHVERGPAEMKVLRLGRQRDGSKVGIFGYAQEHAREYQTTLVALEAAERLLRNHATDADARRLLNNVDIFIAPTMNPDGTNYAMYDYAAQRKNMTNYCTEIDGDPNRRNSWGVDLNRNHSVGSYFDGYDGATPNCLSGTSSGPAEYSEPESRNQKWLTEQYPNIKFSMNIHSHGGYFMWAPGAYIEDGRIPLPRPSLGVEDYFWDASEEILTAIKEHRGTVIHPGRTGPVIDVLYSAAGNSADEHFYDSDIIAWNFEVGAGIWNGNNWATPQPEPGGLSGFQPRFPEAKDQAMEFANGLIEMMNVAYDYSRDRSLPRSQVVVTEQAEGSTSFTFTTSEAATIYYTLDGSAPTFSSPTVEAEYLRDGAETITVTEDTTVRHFAVDIAGNTERLYDPSRPSRLVPSTTVRVRP